MKKPGTKSGISPSGRILGTRITVYDVLDYAEYHHTFIAAVLGINSHDVFAAQKFIEEHRDEVMRDYEEMLERDRRGNPPEIEKKVRASRAKLRKLLAQKKAKSAEADSCRTAPRTASTPVEQLTCAAVEVQVMGAFADRADMLASWERIPTLELGVIAQVKARLPAALDEVGFDDFSGHDYEVVARLRGQLDAETKRPTVLWGLVAVDLWFCNNFSSRLWKLLIDHDVSNVGFAIETVYWVLLVSGKDCSRDLAELFSKQCVWKRANRFVQTSANGALRQWWRGCVESRRGLPCPDSVDAVRPDHLV